ncbi:MAG TPA: alpha/beta family hydrolase [Bryobacteraceae bacterium]|jgi:predicted alpha/beta-hydrolase family hydrolase
MPERQVTIEAFETAGVRGVLHRPAVSNGDAFALTHGAGSNANAPLLVRMAAALAEAGYLVLRYDLPFRIDRPKGPPFPAMAPRDREGIARAVNALRKLAGGRVFAGGHSYGGRQTAMAAAEHGELTAALLLLSYPLHPPRKPEQMRTGFFPELRTPALFVHGTADPFGTVEELRTAITTIPAHTDLLVVEGAGHDLRTAPAADMLARFQALVCYPEK